MTSNCFQNTKHVYEKSLPSVYLNFDIILFKSCIKDRQFDSYDTGHENKSQNETADEDCDKRGPCINTYTSITHYTGRRTSFYA